MSADSIAVCRSDELENGGLARKFPVLHAGHPTTAFFIRFQGAVYGYLNRCPHQGAELDWEGSVFTRAGDQLMCARHGATFVPDTGECTGGPCRPSRLLPLRVTESQEQGVSMVMWQPDNKVSARVTGSESAS